MKFNLQTGMKDLDIYNELRGKIQGESSEQVLQFYYPKDIVNKDKPEPLHEIIKSNDKYAVIRKNWSIMGNPNHYLSGINDEGTYFVHELPIYTNIDSMSIDEIVKDINIEEHDFERIQGDLLIKFYPFNTIQEQEAGQVRYTGIFKRKIKEESFYPNRFFPTQNVRSELEGGGVNFFAEESDTISIFNNHKLIVIKGKIYHMMGNQMFAVLGEQLIIKHNQHESKTINIPKHHYACITAQKSNVRRGSD